MDELEYAKIGGVICAGLLAFVGFGELSKGVVAMEQVKEPAYQVALLETESSDAEPEEILPIGEMMATADLEKGAKVFKKCASCHKVEAGAANGQGPNLYGIVGRQIASADGFNYSGALPVGEPWTFESLDGFLTKPKDWAPGTSMGFAGLKKPEERAALIAWLNLQGDNPLPIE